MCYLMARLAGARRIFELGSGYGYSTAWFARAVQENGGGEVHHVVWDDQLSQRARKHLDALGYGGLIRYHVAEAVQTLRDTSGPFDLIFNDIDKAGYPASLPVIAEKLRSGGLLIIDNMLWSGKVSDAENTRGVREVTRLLTTGEQWISTLFPLRDGLIVAMKR
jgi:predicted O-methyltransferase YrrM